MTITITWAVLGHLFVSLFFLFGALIGVMIWVWEFDERFPLPMRIFGLTVGVAVGVLLISALSIVGCVAIWL
jgi:hypothetical protein